MEKIKVLLEDDTVLFFEIEEIQGEEPVGGMDIFKLDDFVSTIGHFANLVYDKIAKTHPSNFKLEFGVEVGIESGKLISIITKASGKGNLKATLEWHLQQ